MAINVTHDPKAFVTFKDLEQAIDEAMTAFNNRVNGRLDRIEQKIDLLIGHAVKANGHHGV